jgi:hypothetical protein
MESDGLGPWLGYEWDQLDQELELVEDDRFVVDSPGQVRSEHHFSIGSEAELLIVEGRMENVLDEFSEGFAVAFVHSAASVEVEAVSTSVIMVLVVLVHSPCSLCRESDDALPGRGSHGEDAPNRSLRDRFAWVVDLAFRIVVEIAPESAVDKNLASA